MKSKYGRDSMSAALRRLKRSSFIFILVELLLVAIAVVLYFYDFPKGIKDFAKTEYILIGFSGLIVIDLLFIWIGEMRLSSIRQKNDLSASSIIGSDVLEAYKYGQIGLVVTDSNDIVLWANDLFKERSIDLLDLDILAWQPELASLKNAPIDTEIKIEVSGRNYGVKYLSDANLYLFKDITEIEGVYSYSRETATVIGIFLLDNYADIAGNADDDNNDTVAKVRAAIFDYCKEFGVLLRRFRNDSYFAVCSFGGLSKMEADGFSVLEKVRAAGKGNSIIPTLSIGFAHDFPDVTKLNEMASNAIDIAMSRGGDQAVVSHYGEDLKFFGGKTAAIENTGRVQFRSLGDSLVSLIRASSNVIVSGHTDMDMDALGACLGVMAISEWCKKPCRLVFDPKLTEKKTLYAFQSAFTRAELDAMTVSPKEAEDRIKPSTLFVVVDVSVPQLVMGHGALERSAKTVVIDHHRRGEAFIERPVLTYVDASASSASEILAEIIHYATANPRIEVKPSYATLMLSGMFLDANFFKSKSTGIRTFEAAEILKEYGADNALADDYLKDEYEEYALTTSIVSTLRTPYTGVVYCTADEHDIVERAALSKVANQLMQLKGINACFVIGRTQEKEIRISARSDGTAVNVQLLCEKMGGGGHFAAAACAFRDTNIAAVEAKLLDTLESYLSEARSNYGGKNR